jgi:hypothetical protein
MMRRCVWSGNLVNEEALAHWGLSRQKKKKVVCVHVLCCDSGTQEKGSKSTGVKRKDILRNTHYIHVAQHVYPRHREKYKVRMGLWEAEKNREVTQDVSHCLASVDSNELSGYIKCEDFLD